MGSRNAAQIDPKDWDATVTCLHKKWGPEQIADQVGISHETIYRHAYADKAAGGSLYQQQRCQKKRKKRYASGRERRGQIVSRRPMSASTLKPDPQGHWEGDTVIGAAHKKAIVP